MQNQNTDAMWSNFDNVVAEEQGLDVWGFLNRRKAFIILLGLVGMVLGYVYYERQIPQYRSTATLRVIHRSNTDSRVKEIMQENNLSNSQWIVTSPLVLEPCVTRLLQEDLTVLKGLQDTPEDRQIAIQRIQSMVEAEEVAKDIVALYCKGADSGDTGKIAQALAEEFIRDQEKTYKTARTEIESLIKRATEKLQSELTELRNSYDEFDSDSELTSEGVNPYVVKLEAVEKQISSIEINQLELTADLESLERAVREKSPRDAILMMIGRESEGRAGDTPKATEEVVTNAKNMFQALMPLLMEEALLAEEYGPGYPKLKALRKRIEITRIHFETLAGMTPKSKRSTGEPAQRTDFLTVYMNSLREQLSKLKTRELKLRDLAKNHEQQANALRDEVRTRARFVADIAGKESLLRDLGHQITKMELPTNVGGVKASILQGASDGILIFPKLPQFLGIGGFLGAFVGLALGYLVEMADRSFRKPDEIIREFGIPILGHIPYMQEQKLRKIPRDTVMDRTIITLHLPRSRPSEAYRSVRTAVCFSAMGSSHRVIQVTSPAAGDGKSTLAMNFAVSLAQSGKKTIIIESDFRRPKVHKLTGVDNSLGVVDVLRGSCEIADAVQETEIDDFFVMPCGSRPRNPSELITRPEYEQLLNALRDRFEYVIVDTPPVLVVTDPCSVAPRADGVLLCVRLSRHTRDFGRRALEQLRDVGADMTGIVINGVEESDAYGYGNYSYSDYRYRYNDYSQNYGYGEQGNEAYFAEAETDQDSEYEVEEVAN